jgi:hypothetical protein
MTAPRRSSSRPDECEACRASRTAAQPPRPFTDFPKEVEAARDQIYLLALIGILLGDRFTVSDACDRLRVYFQENGITPEGDRYPCYNTVRYHIPGRLHDLLVSSFGRKVGLFKKERGRICGLSEVGLVAARLAREFVDQEADCSV